MKKILILAVLLIVGGAGAYAYADHSWGTYHWARAANPFNLKLGDNVSVVWDASLAGASSDWSLSSVLDTNISAGATNPKNCKAVAGRVEVCDAKYGRNGWLGIASIWVSGSHITRGTVKLNDTYFNTAKYNTPAWRNVVMCQEIGHTLGLDHQDENFNNADLGTCMDYSNNPEANQHPNQHDYDQLEAIYSHLDSSTTLSQQTASSAYDDESEGPVKWGKLVKRGRNGQPSLYARDLGRGEKVFTFVTWAN